MKPTHIHTTHGTRTARIGTAQGEGQLAGQTLVIYLDLSVEPPATHYIEQARWDAEWQEIPADACPVCHGSGTDQIKRRKDRPCGGCYGRSWKPSIHMPRWASRILLEVTAVRVERLQDITEDDAQAEGAFFTDYGRRCHHAGPPRDASECPEPDEHHPQRAGWSMVPTDSHEQCLLCPRMAFANLWDSINGAGSWEANPYVWVVEFRRVAP